MRGFGGSPDTAAHIAYLPSHTHAYTHTHALRCLEQPGSKENNKYSECTHAFFYSHTQTHTERSAWVTVSLADRGAGVRFGWLKQREKCFKASALGCRPEPPQAAATASLHFRDQDARTSFRGLSLLCSVSFLLIPPTANTTPLAYIHPRHSSFSLLLASIRPSSFSLMPPGADRRYLHVWGRRCSVEGQRSR